MRAPFNLRLDLSSPSRRLGLDALVLGLAAAFSWQKWAQVLAIFEWSFRRVDFAYFWGAGKIWLDGGSPYGPTYQPLVETAIRSDAVYPFFYPPGLLPLIAPFGYFDVDTAGGFYLIACAFIAAAMLSMTAATMKKAIGGLGVVGWFGLSLFVFSVLMPPAHRVLIHGQITLLFAAALAAWVYCLDAGRTRLAGAALAILLLKPQFGLALLVMCLVEKKHRPVALWGVAGAGALTIIGLANTGAPISALTTLAENMRAYAEAPQNESFVNQRPRLPDRALRVRDFIRRQYCDDDDRATDARPVRA